MTRDVESITWEREDGETITTEMAQYDVVVGSYDDETNSQTTSLTVQEGVSSLDTTYKCVVNRGGVTIETSVYLNVFCESPSFLSTYFMLELVSFTGIV